jgi:Rad3-related DNA helicase
VAGEALFGFAGVVLGSLTTSVLTIYKDRLTARRDIALREQQYERDRDNARNAFQRESILALQSAVSDLLKAVYEELDRVIAESKERGTWPARQWETPTAKGWSEALLRLEESRARVFDEELRSLAGQFRGMAGDSIWAPDLETAKETSRRLEPLQARFHERVGRIIPSLY